MFRNRKDAGRRLAAQLKGRTFRHPLVLAIPRGGLPVGGMLADALEADLDVVFSRKLRAPMQPELAIGAVSEGGEVYLNMNKPAREALGIDEEYLRMEKHFQLAEIARRAALFREVRPRADISGRSVIVTDDGIATGATMIAAIHLLRTQSPHELIVAVPVASPRILAKVRSLCDSVVCLHAPIQFHSIGDFYQDFSQIEDNEVVAILREHYTNERSNDQLMGSSV